MIAYVVKWEITNKGIADKDLFCEAYFNGCDLYEHKTNNNIMCAD